QQAFLKEAKDQLNSSSLIDKSNKLIDIFGRSTQTDKSLETSAGLIGIFKLAVFSAGHPVRQIPFPGHSTSERLSGGAVIDYIVASSSQVRHTVDEFLHPPAPAPAQPTPSPGKTPHKGKGGSSSPAAVSGLLNGQRSGGDLVAPVAAKSRLRFPIYFPKYVTSSSHYSDPAIRAYTLHDRAAKLRHAYRLVLSADVAQGQYWGVQGTDWIAPPLLQGTHSFLTRHGRKLAIYKNGSHVHVVAWRHGSAVYWVVNTLSDLLDNRQIIEIASTLTRKFS
ncbi:MAG: polyisoprenyl-teichoic acid--peptidoglycan teichoic acid transferase, partial [Solirubrobacteraceae bacterium]|nr:polyisoprenyl-teichoic acid--peptidoglycan teichoic acid transferase [Solirubrobacteraceae bacterium]